MHIDSLVAILFGSAKYLNEVKIIPAGIDSFTKHIWTTCGSVHYVARNRACHLS